MKGSEKTVMLKKAMIEALNKCCGRVKDACQQTGVGVTTHYDWSHDDPEYKKQWLQSKRGAIHLAESALHREMQEGGKGAVTAAIFLLKTLGKDQGYVERQEIEVTDIKTPSWFTTDKGEP